MIVAWNLPHHWNQWNIIHIDHDHCQRIKHHRRRCMTYHLYQEILPLPQSQRHWRIILPIHVRICPTLRYRWRKTECHHIQPWQNIHRMYQMINIVVLVVSNESENIYLCGIMKQTWWMIQRHIPTTTNDGTIMMTIPEIHNFVKIIVLVHQYRIHNIYHVGRRICTWNQRKWYHTVPTIPKHQCTPYVTLWVILPYVMVRIIPNHYNHVHYYPLMYNSEWRQHPTWNRRRCFTHLVKNWSNRNIRIGVMIVDLYPQVHRFLIAMMTTRTLWWEEILQGMNAFHWMEIWHRIVDEDGVVDVKRIRSQSGEIVKWTDLAVVLIMIIPIEEEWTMQMHSITVIVVQCVGGKKI